MAQQSVLVAMDRFETGGVAYAPGTIITDTSEWPEGSLQTRLARGSVAFATADVEEVIPPAGEVQTPESPKSLKPKHSR